MQLVVNSLDREHWDAFVTSSPHGHFMQSYAWGELQGAEGWQAHYLALIHEGAIHAASLLLSRPIPLTGKRLFHSPRGPVLGASADAGTYSAFVGEMRSYVGRLRGAFVRVDPYLEEGSPVLRQLANVGFAHVPRDWSYWNGPKFVFWLDLERDEDSILQSMAGVCRREIRAGYKRDVRYSVGSASDLPEFYRLLASMSSNKGIAVHDAAYYERLYTTLNRSCEVALFLASLENKIIAVGMSVRYGSKAWLLYAASDREYYKLRVNRTVQWEMIKWARAQGCTRYDFRGTATGDPPNPNDPGYGVYEFKKSFGPTFVRLGGYFDLPVSPLMYRMFRFGEERALPSIYKAKVWLDERRSAHHSRSME